MLISVLLYAVLTGAILWGSINLHVTGLLGKALMDAYDIISFEEQLEESVIIRIQTSNSVHIKNFLESKVINLVTSFRAQASIDAHNRFRKETMVQILLAILAGVELIKIRKLMVSQVEMTAYAYLYKDLPREKRAPYETFLETGTHSSTHGLHMSIFNLYLYKKYARDSAEIQEVNSRIEELQFLSNHMPMVLIKKASTGEPTKLKPQNDLRSMWDDSLVPT